MSNTSTFYAGEHPPSLFWELTVCQSLADPASLCHKALRQPRPYGRILAEFLMEVADLQADWSVVEVGGGTGSLMAAFLDVVPLAELTMVDISPYFSGQQRRVLGGYGDVRFVVADALDYFADEPRPVDLVISNENLGDLPTVTNLRSTELRRVLESGDGRGLLGEVADVVRTYSLDLSGAPEIFHFNLGAIRYLERLAPIARHVFLSEHSSAPNLPEEYSFLPLPEGDGYPRAIPLKGHTEYTIHFGQLARVAEALGYRVRRLSMAELVGLRADAGLRAMARTRTTVSETTEIVHEFCEHVAEYECLLLESR